VALEALPKEGGETACDFLATTDPPPGKHNSTFGGSQEIVCFLG